MWLRGHYKYRVCKHIFHEPIIVSDKGYVCPECRSKDYEWIQVASPI